MEDAAGSGDEGAVFVEFGEQEDGLVLRSISPSTSQHIVGLVMPLLTGKTWIRSDDWSRNLFGIRRKVLRRKE